MAKITSVKLTVSEDVQFSQVLSAWQDSDWDFVNETPPFMREVFDVSTSPYEREYTGETSDERTLTGFLDEVNTLCRSGKSVVVDLTDGELYGSVTWNQNNVCEFVFFGSQLCLPKEEGKPARRTDWNRVVSAITTPLHEKGIFVLWITLYEEFI